MTALILIATATPAARADTPTAVPPGTPAGAPAGVPAPAAAGTTPVELRPVSDINAGDTAWMLTSSALVLMMTGPALALFYSGLVRRKNVLGTVMQSFAMMALVSVVWAVIGYSLAFDVGTPFIGGPAVRLPARGRRPPPASTPPPSPTRPGWRSR